MKYFHQSQPTGWGDDHHDREPLWLGLLRFCCSALNHHPRFPTGSWCSGYGYVCERCHMYADRFSPEKQEAVARTIREMEKNGPVDPATIAGLFGGGPHA